MSTNLPPIAQVQEESFTSRTKEILHLYQSLMQSSRERLLEIKDYFIQTRRKPLWQNILDLRIIGVALLVTSISLKCFSVSKDEKILDTNEFITVFIVGTLFLILGTYFNAKELQEERKMIEKENETTTATFTAYAGLMNR